MRDPRRERPGKFALAAAAVFAVLAKVADASAVSKSAVVLCFVSLAAAYFLLPNRSAAAELTSDDDPGGRQSLPSRIAWAVWLSLAAGACFGIAQLAGALTPALQLPFRVVGAVLLMVAAYKLFFGRRGNNMDVDL